MKKIVCLSSSNWYPFPTSKQEIMQRLSDSEILYFDPPVTLIAPLKDKSARIRLKAYRMEEKRPRPNIYVCALPPILPFGNRFRIINRINQCMTARFVRKKMKAHGFGEESILWMYLPGHCDIVRKLKVKAKVYTCVDRHSGYKGQINPALVDSMEDKLAASCDAVFTTAKGLYERLSPRNPHTWLVPNGVNYKLFSAAQKTQAVPEALQGIRGPVIGFIGALQQCIDYPLLARLAKERPNYTFVFAGREHPDAEINLIRNLPNVKLLGLLPQTELPAYLARFDVCLNPFRTGSLSRDVSPLKFYEYLATGKPIVSTPEPVQVQDFADAVCIAADADEFIRKVDEALNEDTPERREKRIAYARACSWDARAEMFEAHLKECGIF